MSIDSTQSQARQTTFELDRDAAIDAIASLWALSPAEPASWRLDRFGDDLACSLENLAGVVFSRHRGLVDGPPLEVRVFPVADAHAQPLLVCIADAQGPMLCRGIEDLAETLPDPWGASPEIVVDALQFLLDAAAAVLDGAEDRLTTTRRSLGDRAREPIADPIIS